MTDRGENGIGYGGVKLLEDIKILCDKYSDRVIYIPGNHDTFVYEYGKYNNSYFLESLKQYDTIDDIKYLKENFPDKLNILMTWLGDLPIQRVHEFDGKKFVLAHAFFYQNLYMENPNYSLESIHQIGSSKTGNNLKKYRELCNVLWYRTGDYYNSMDVPTEVIEVIGHTPKHTRKGLNLDLENAAGGITKVFCVDGGVAFGYDMLKYDGKDEVLETPYWKHTDTSPNETSKSNQINDKIGLEILVKGINETTSRHGLRNMKYILKGILQRKPDWYIYFSRCYRDDIEALGGERVHQIINDYSRLNDKFDIASIIDSFLNRLYEENEEFKKIVDKEGFKDIRVSLSDNIRENDRSYSEKKNKYFKKKLYDDIANKSTVANDVVISKENDLKFDYVSLYIGDRLIVIFKMDDNQMEFLVSELIRKYGIDLVKKSAIFDYNSLINSINPGEIATLGDTDCRVFMNENGDIIILNGNGEEVYSFKNIGSLKNVKTF